MQDLKEENTCGGGGKQDQDPGHPQSPTANYASGGLHGVLVFHCANLVCLGQDLLFCLKTYICVCSALYERTSMCG